MGHVFCATHNRKACWSCDDCPTCGNFKRLLKGEYCPKCTAKIKAKGAVWSEYEKNYVMPEDMSPHDKMYDKYNKRPDGFPKLCVEGRGFDKYPEARAFAMMLSTELQRPIDITQKDDAFSPWFLLEQISCAI